MGGKPFPAVTINWRSLELRRSVAEVSDFILSGSAVCLSRQRSDVHVFPHDGKAKQTPRQLSQQLPVSEKPRTSPDAERT